MTSKKENPVKYQDTEKEKEKENVSNKSCRALARGPLKNARSPQVTLTLQTETSKTVGPSAGELLVWFPLYTVMAKGHGVLGFKFSSRSSGT